MALIEWGGGGGGHFFRFGLIFVVLDGKSGGSH